MSDYYDELETRTHGQREDALFSGLPTFLTDVTSRISGWKDRFAGLDLSKINSRDALATLPVMRKPELMESQSATPPFGGFVDINELNGNRIFMSPGPIWEPQAAGTDPWLAARGLHAAGVRKGDIVHCAIGYTMTPGGMILDYGARALGAITYPAGVGNTEMQVEAIATLKPGVYAGTPDYLQTIIDKADEIGRDVSSINRGFVSGGALFPAMRAAYADRGIRVMQAYATADIGAIAFETLDPSGEICEGMICNENLIIEIVRPGTDDPVALGEVGEIVVTTFNKAYPLIRFGTGDMSAIIEEPSPCGRTNMRIKGWMGRADQRTKIKGMFVDPKQVDQIVKNTPGVENARLEVLRKDNKDEMVLKVTGSEFDIDTAAQNLQRFTNLKGTVEQVAELPNDGKVIDDKRDYEA